MCEVGDDFESRISGKNGSGESKTAKAIAEAQLAYDFSKPD
jgi:cytidylate kinase